ncbi:MAG: alpha/beta fold hydrolase [Candidatus Sericytochromatia bacterium]
MGVAQDFRPFQQRPYASLPARPRRPHSYFQHPGKRLAMHSEAFGELDIHWLDVGSGPPLLLIHGLMTTSYSWRYILDLLSPHYRLIIPDLPGCGRSDKPLSHSFRPGSFARWLGEFQRELGIEGCACVANSMGGYLAMHQALNQPGAYSHLLNIHSPGWPEARIYALNLALQVPGAAWGLNRFIRLDPLRWAHANTHYYDEGLKSLEEAEAYGLPLASWKGAESLIRFLAETMHPRDMEHFVAALRQRAARKQAFPSPMTLIYARQDPMVPPEFGHNFSRLLPGTPLIWLEQSSHFPQVDTPEALSTLILEILNK